MPAIRSTRVRNLVVNSSSQPSARTTRQRLGARGPTSQGANNSIPLPSVSVPVYTPTVTNPQVLQQSQNNIQSYRIPNTLPEIPTTGNPFQYPVNLMSFLCVYHNGPFIVNTINAPGDLDEFIIYDVVKACLTLLYKKTKTLKFGRFKRTLLHNIAKSIIGTFPRLADVGEQGEPCYVSFIFF